jgi:hypothetical protein
MPAPGRFYLERSPKYRIRPGSGLSWWMAVVNSRSILSALSGSRTIPRSRAGGSRPARTRPDSPTPPVRSPGAKCPGCNGLAAGSRRRVRPEPVISGSVAMESRVLFVKGTSPWSRASAHLSAKTRLVVVRAQSGVGRNGRFFTLAAVRRRKGPILDCRDVSPGPSVSETACHAFRPQPKAVSVQLSAQTSLSRDLRTSFILCACISRAITLIVKLWGKA